MLVVDQTENDKSISCGAANEKTFHQMLEAALTENPDAEVWIKTHPDTLSNKKRSYFTNLSPDPRIHLITEPTNPLSIIEQMDKVYVVTSQMGFEALLLGKKVICFGIPWSAGWGLTEERNPQISIVKERRDKIRSLEELFAAAYFKYTKYLHPENNKRGTLFDLLDWISLNKKNFQKISGNFLLLRLSPWKKAIVSPFLKNNNSKIKFLNSIHDFNTEKTSVNSKIILPRFSLRRASA